MLQLRRADGSLQTHEEEFYDIRDYFRNLYDGPSTFGDHLSEPVSFSQEEVTGLSNEWPPARPCQLTLRLLQCGKPCGTY